MFDSQNDSDQRMKMLVQHIRKLADCEKDLEKNGDKFVMLDQTLKIAEELETVLTQQSERIAYLDKLATTDSLTALLNRRGFEKELEHVLACARRFNEKGVLAYVDLDGFKNINDTYGHACGDEVLKKVGILLEYSIRDMDYVARLGGDEFAILLVRTNWKDGQARAQKIADMLNSNTIRWNGVQIPIRASLGIQRFNCSSRSKELLHAADTSMYTIKKMKNEVEQTQCSMSAAQ